MSGLTRVSEDKIAHDHDRSFKLRAKGVKALGQWAAQQLDLTGEAAAAYARNLVIVDFEEPGDDDVLRRLEADLSHLNIGRAELRDRLAVCLAEAVARND